MYPRECNDLASGRIWISVAAICSIVTFGAITQPIEVEPERLGNPFLGKPVYSRNVWDLTVFDDKLFLGHGDSAVNTGSFNPLNNAKFEGVPVWSYTPEGGFVAIPVDGATTSLGGVDEEQIDRFVITENRMIIPGHDPIGRDNWRLGNYYIYDAEANRFTKHRVLPDGIHAYDAYDDRGDLYFALGTASRKHKGSNGYKGLAQVAIVKPKGEKAWRGAGAGGNTEAYLEDGLTWTSRLRGYELFTLAGGVYLAESSRGFAGREPIIMNDPKTGQEVTLTNATMFQTVGGSARISKLDRQARTFVPTDLSVDDVYPGSERNLIHVPAPARDAEGKEPELLPIAVALGEGAGVAHRLLRPIEFSGHLVYIGGVSNNDHSYKPVAVYVATPGFESVRFAEIPAHDEKRAVVPWDLKTVGDRLYLLTSEKLGDARYRVVLRVTTDTRTWRETLWFEAPTFARSFARYQDAWYFGLGSIAGALSPATGDILRVKPRATTKP